MTPIGLIAPLSQVASAYRTVLPKAAGDGSGFASMVGDAASAAMNTLRTAERTTARGVAGRADVQEVVQALGSAEVTMQAVVAVRDKIVGAYNDIMRMSV
jgi:flagellar hook-basal body complex protein FliE